MKRIASCRRRCRRLRWFILRFRATAVGFSLADRLFQACYVIAAAAAWFLSIDAADLFLSHFLLIFIFFPLFRHYRLFWLCLLD